MRRLSWLTGLRGQATRGAPRLHVHDNGNIGGLEVLIDGKVAGRAPLTVETLPAPARHLVEAKRVGYSPYAEWVEVKRGQRRVLTVTLAASAGAQGSRTRRG